MTKYVYDLLGRAVEQINADGSKTRTVYDALGRTTESYDELGGKTATTYDANGNQLTVTDPKGNKTSYQYNRKDQITVITYADGGETRYTYNALGNVSEVTDQNGNVVEEIGANVRRQVISKSASETIRQIMEYEVGDGTTTGGGSNAYVAGYRIGGKSGTSEQLNMDRRADGDYKKVASFAAVLPANDPEILVYVMLDDPNNAHTDYSSILAAPVVGNIISEIAPYLGIATDGIDRSQNTVKVPNLVGKEWSNAQVSLNTKGLKHQLVESESDQTAAVVTYQYPHAGATVASGTTIYLYTDTYSGSHTEVPDVSGKSADFARQMLTAAGLNCQVAGDSAGTVQSQSEAAGSSVQKGTVVTITCG